ncbi:MAG: hypothetical protein Q7U04_13570 [Bacteriovorax sp.]|nr:hypothetical protein [Bacteriovorax sp.]
MSDMPFEKYEFLAILPPGFLLLSVNYIHFDLKTIFNPENVVHTVSLFIISYILGQILAEFSIFIIEGLTKKILGDPVYILADKCKSFKMTYLTNYQKPFQQPMLKNFNDHLLKENIKDEDLSGWAYGVLVSKAKNAQDSSISSKLQGWQRLFGFARNCSMALLLQSIIFFIAYYTTRSEHNIWLGIIALFLSYMLYLRYLKFFKTYSVELICWHILKS